MLDIPLMQLVVSQMLMKPLVQIGSQTLPVRRIGSGRLRTVRFRMNGREYQAIEQNREKPSRWGQLAREGHQVVQFKDVETNRYVAVAIDGQIKEYGRKK
jgi:hypothetical protein